MKKQFYSFLLLLIFFVISTAAQKPQPADVAEQNLRKHIEYLASDQLEGRRTGEPGALLASQYIAKQFSAFKLKPGYSGQKGDTKPSYRQPFPYISGVSLGEKNRFELDPATAHNGAPLTLEIGVNWMPLGSSPNADIARAEIQFAGYGITSADLKRDDYANRDIRGKAALIFDGSPDAGNPHSPFARFDIYAKANIAKEKGAVALIVIATEKDFKNDRLTRLSYDRTNGETAIPVIAIDRELAARFLRAKDDTELLEIEKQGFVKEAVPPPGHILISPAAIADIKIDLVKKHTDAYNVIGILEGTDPQLKNEAIVIGAHYDHLGHGGQGSLAVNSSEIHHGADDNASGTSAVLELARRFAKEKKNKRTLLFIAFSGEEEGLLGSSFYVNNPVWPLEKTIAMINLDMVGRLKDNKLTIGGIGTAPEWKAMVEEINSPKVLQASLIPTKYFGSLQLNEDGFGPSDHSSFYGKKIPVLFFFTGTHEDYHKPSDTFDKINYKGLSSITSYISSIIRSIDQNPTRPTYTVAKSSGTMGRTGFNVSLGTVPNYADSTDGLLLDGVRDGSPAARAGIKSGDRIVKLAGKEVRNINDYTFILGEMKAGEEYEVVLKRGVETFTLKIVPAPARRQ